LTPYEQRKQLKKGKQKLKAADKAVERIRIKALRKNHISPKNLREAEKRKEGRPLTTKQRDFVREWARGEVISTACARADLHVSEGYRLAKDPAILKLYNEEKRLYEDAAQMSRKKVMDMLQDAFDCAKLVCEPASMVAAARELGKMCGYYEQKIVVEHKIGGKLLDRMSTMTDEQLLEIMETGGGETIIGEARRIADESHMLESQLEQPST
jgi:phage terminase small subunit